MDFNLALAIIACDALVSDAYATPVETSSKGTWQTGLSLDWKILTKILGQQAQKKSSL